MNTATYIVQEMSKTSEIIHMKKPKNETISIRDNATVKMSEAGMAFTLVKSFKHMKRIQICKGTKNSKSKTKELSDTTIPK